MQNKVMAAVCAVLLLAAVVMLAVCAVRLDRLNAVGVAAPAEGSGRYTVAVERRTVDGEAIFAVTLYGPDGGAVCCVEAFREGDGGMEYDFSWLDTEPPIIDYG